MMTGAEMLRRTGKWLATDGSFVQYILSNREAIHSSMLPSITFSPLSSKVTFLGLPYEALTNFVCKPDASSFPVVG